MDLSEIIESGLVFGSKKKGADADKPKKNKVKLSGSQQMRADYKARKAKEGRVRAEKQAARKAKKNGNN